MTADEWAGLILLTPVFLLVAAIAVGMILEYREYKQSAVDRVRRRADEQAAAFNRDPDRYLTLIEKGRDPVVEMRLAPRPPRGSGGIAQPRKETPR